MPRTTINDLAAWPALTLEGNLIAPAMVAKIADPDDKIETRDSYCIRKGLTIREEISTAFRVGQSHYDAFVRQPHPSADTTRRFVRDFLKETFGFDDLVPLEGTVSFLAGERVPIVVVPPDEERLDRRSPTLSIDRSRSPAYALQDYLNDHDSALWGMACNGTLLRLMRDNASLTRPAYIEADLSQIFTNEDAASFAVLWLLIHRSRFGRAGAPPTDCELERWRDAGTREGTVARDRLAGQVQEALQTLGSGFLEANPELARQIQSGELRLTDWFNELLRLIYRLIFLMVAEDRNLLHSEKARSDARKLYAEGYSLAMLRTQSVRRAAWDRFSDRYEGIKIVFRALTQGQDALALPALGGLFADDQLPHLEKASLRNRALMEALYRLSWLKDSAGMVPVNWRAMETEELGSVYESLLELQPQLGDDGKSLNFAQHVAEQRGNQRKTTGSYYTPDSLVQALLDTALDPVLNKTVTEANDPAAAILRLTVIDPACGSGHFLLAAARRMATRLARIRDEGTPALSDYRHALRDVARTCLHGVDRNPMAVELTKVALWIETVDPGLPLGFFDAQIRCGDSLLGLFDLDVFADGIPAAAYKPLAGDDKETAKYYLKANKEALNGQVEIDFESGGGTMPAVKPLAESFANLRDMREDTVAQIRAKERRFRELAASPAFARARAAADLYVAAFLMPKAGAAPLYAEGRSVPTTYELWRALSQDGLPLLMDAAAAVARKALAFHWPLEFPDVMANGGFDVVLGNPPWEVLQLSEKEYFAATFPDIASLAGAARKRAIESLQSENPAAFGAFIETLHLSEAGNEFARASGRFDLTARGKVNTYSLFAELFASLARDRAGVIVPTGIATDASTAPFFSYLVEKRRLARLVDFENRAGLFPAVDSRMKFSLLTLGRNEAVARFAFFLTDPAQLAEPERNFTLSPEEIAAINPNTNTAPVFRSRADAELTAKIYSRAPVLIDETKGKSGNPWGVEFRQGLFNMTSDSDLFRTAAQLAAEGYVRDGVDWVKGAQRCVPLYEAKMIHQFDHRWAGYAGNGSDVADVDLAQKQDPAYEPAPRYWVPEEEVDERLTAKGWERGWLMGWRDITNATNERTVIATVFPKAGVNHKMPIFFTGTTVDAQVALFTNLNSLVFDFVARQKVGGTNLAFFYLKQLPILPPAFYSKPRLDFVVPRVLELTYTSHSMAPFARDLGFAGHIPSYDLDRGVEIEPQPYKWDENRRAQLRAELDAFYARAYGLSRDELLYILDPADVKGPDYPSETFRVLKDKEQRQYGEYRTRRLVLNAWDALEADGTFRRINL